VVPTLTLVGPMIILKNEFVVVIDLSRKTSENQPLNNLRSTFLNHKIAVSICLLS